ncbi:MAG TPA: IclR family transcriptional regulator [Chloroflexota bacterium]|nr:IclR family transcriptional regulator [Chloroflexota bacterium]HZU06795.1 IclR family transcriptional regulator [Chloroflexota bacterium]
MGEPSTRPAAPRLVPAVDRAIRILDALRRDPQAGGISELARRLGLHKATVRDILLTLHHHGLVERDPLTARFRLGYGLYAYVGALGEGSALPAVARPFLRQLMEQTGETVLLGMRDGERILIVDKEEPPRDLKISAPVGRRLPLYAGSFGKVLLADLEPAQLEQLLARRPPPAFTARSVTDPAAYRALLQQVRERGYAVDDEEYLDGVRAVTAPIRGADGATLAALTVVGFTTRIPDARLALLVDAVVAAARQISLRLGAGPLPQGLPADGRGDGRE